MSHASRHRLAPVILAFALLAAGAAPAAAQVKGLKIGDTAPTARVQTLEGAPADLADIVGKRPAIIEFWATWCPLCRQMEPTLKALHAKYGDRVALVRIVVPQNQTPERAKEFVAKHELPGTFYFDADGAAYKAFAAYHTSYIIVLNAAGRVVHSEDGGAQDLEPAIQRALRAGAP
jgi:thiol-disulfide isomerase/thioredoxin